MALAPLPSSLELAVLGNAHVAALVDTEATVVWMCVPRFDGDPIFCRLLNGDDTASRPGQWAIELLECDRIEQDYLPHTPILKTVITDRNGGQIEIIDFVPRYEQFGRVYAPVGLMRIVRRVAGRPRIQMRFEPACDYGRSRPTMTYGSNHMRALMPGQTVRLTTDAPITFLNESRPFFVETDYSFVLGPDETLAESPRNAARRALELTQQYWIQWARGLALPFEWQKEVIRAAITLKLATFDDTGGIVAALTTSIPESPDSGRNWDYRYCWLRDAYFVVNALNRLGATATLEHYLSYLENLVADWTSGPLQPVYSLTGSSKLHESECPSLPGYRGMGPVRIGNQAYEQIQHDVYGTVVMGVCHVFFDERLAHHADPQLFHRLERLGEQAWKHHDAPDAGIWEFRGRQAVHTFSSVMCWAACDRLARVARRIELPEAARRWAQRAQRIHRMICRKAWSNELNAFAATFGGDQLDASLLLLGELNFLPPTDPRLIATVAAIGQGLRRGDYLLRYQNPDDFGLPHSAFLVCTFWWIQALAQQGHREQARQLFTGLLARRNRFGLLSEDIDPATGELWGNFPQTYSMVGIITCAMRLSSSWDEAY